MKDIPILLPDVSQPKWAMPHHFLNLFKWNGLDSNLKILTSSFEISGRTAYILNLNNQYRLDYDLAKKKSPKNPCVYEAFDEKIWLEIEKKNGILVLDSCVKALVARDDIAAGLLRGIAAARIDPNRVFVINCNLRSSSLFHEKYLCQLDQKPTILDFDSCFWLLSGYNKLSAENESALKEREISITSNLLKSRSCKFVSFNGRMRPHRFYVVLWLLANGLFDSGKISFLGYTTKSDMRAHLLKLRYPEYETSMKSFDDLISRLPITLDVSLEASQKGDAFKTSLPWISQPSELYDQSWFSIIVDTSFDPKDYLFLTPIAFKSFMNFSPFVYFGNCGALKRMKALGFRTFSPLIDESYDELSDPNTRMEKALNEVRRLCYMTGNQLREMYLELLPILTHNYWHFYQHAPAKAESVLESEILNPLGFTPSA